MARPDDQIVSPFFGITDEPTAEPTAKTEPETATASVEGEIAVDVHETEDALVIVSPIAGVEPDHVTIAADDDAVTISGERRTKHTRNNKQTHIQEIYWGAFSRTVELPMPCEVDQAQATFKHGVLTVRIPKSSKSKKRTIKVKTLD